MRKTPFAMLSTIIAMVVSARAAQPLVDFEASTFHTGDKSWTDSAHGVVATGTGTPVADGTSINTSTGSFTFKTDDAKMTGLTSYTLAVAFTGTSITAAGALFYGANGIIGADIPGVGQGDGGVGLTTDGAGQIVAGLGLHNSSDSPDDQNLYDTNATGQGTFSTNKLTGAVLVVDGTGGKAMGKAALYVNGVLTTQPGTLTGITILPLGSNSGATAGIDYGIGAITNGYGGTLQGSVLRVEIFGNALSDADAAALSLSVTQPPSHASSSK